MRENYIYFSAITSTIIFIERKKIAFPGAYTYQIHKDKTEGRNGKHQSRSGWLSLHTNSGMNATPKYTRSIHSNRHHIPGNRGPDPPHLQTYRQPPVYTRPTRTIKRNTRRETADSRTHKPPLGTVNVSYHIQKNPYLRFPTSGTRY